MEDRSLKVTAFCIGVELSYSKLSYAVDMFSANGERITVFVPLSKAVKDVTVTEEDENGELVETIVQEVVFKEGHHYTLSCIQSKAGEPILDHTTGEQLVDKNGELRFAKSNAIRGLSVEEVSESAFDKLTSLYAKFK